MSEYRFEFVTGCPGSGWSNITRITRQHLNEFYDMSDLKDYRCHKIPDTFFKKHIESDSVIVPKENKLTHFGSYFGPAAEYGQNFDSIRENYSRDEFIKECLLPFDTNSTAIKQVKSHWFAYDLDWLWENFKGHHLVLIWRDPDASYTHWYDVGGWDITYPKYDWYQQFNSMKDQIKKEADLVLDFIDRKNLELINYNDDWFNKCYSEFNKPYQAPRLRHSDTRYTIKIARTIIQ